MSKWAQELFPQGGFYIEAGAHDGVGDSQTYDLEQTGKWKGICVEPSRAFGGLQRSRKCHIDNRCLWKASGEQIVFREIGGNDVELSGIPSCFKDHWDRQTRPYKERWVMSVTLTDLCRQHKAPNIIAFLSLDTEGSEYEILSAHDFKAYLILTMVVEHNGVPESIAKLDDLLLPLGYKVHSKEQVVTSYKYRTMK